MSFKRGDKVRCVNVGTNVDITVGKVYEVLRQFKESTTVTITNDVGNNCGYYQSRFELVEEDKQ